MKTSFNTFFLFGMEKSLRKSVFKIQLNQNQNPLLTPCPDSNLKLSVVLVFALQEISENLVIVFQLIEYNGHCDGYSGYANKSSKSVAANRTDSTNVHDFDSPQKMYITRLSSRHHWLDKIIWIMLEGNVFGLWLRDSVTSLGSNDQFRSKLLEIFVMIVHSKNVCSLIGNTKWLFECVALFN